MYNRTQNATPLTHEQLIYAAPSIATATAHGSRSMKYIVEPTLRIVEALENEGMFPIYAAQRAVKKAEYKHFTKHIVIMRQDQQFDEYCPEILITNSHDGSTSRTAELGIFRKACANGLILNEANLGKFSSTHVQHDDDFIEGVFSVLATAKNTGTKIEAMKAKILTFEEAKLFSLQAMKLRWEDPPIPTEQLVNSARRNTDVGLSLWKVFNRTQEHLQRGGNKYRKTGRTSKTAPIKSIDETLRINRELGHLALSYL